MPVIDDVGSGVLADELEVLREEPAVRRSVQAGAALVCFSGDKLLGGPQAGLMVGRADAVAAARAHPLARALRLDKLGAGGARGDAAALPRSRARTARDPGAGDAHGRRSDAARAREPACRGDRRAAEVVAATARVGGGALPLLELPGPAVAVSQPGLSADDLAARLRAADPPVIARIEDDRVLLDPRTLADDELTLVARAVAS